MKSKTAKIRNIPNESGMFFVRLKFNRAKVVRKKKNNISARHHTLL